MTLNTVLLCANVVLSAIAAVPSIIASVDQVKKGDERAAIAGAAAGKVIAQHAQENNWWVCCGFKVGPDGKIIG